MSLSRCRRIEAGFIALWLLAAIAYEVHRVSSYPAADGS